RTPSTPRSSSPSGSAPPATGTTSPCCSARSPTPPTGEASGPLANRLAVSDHSAPRSLRSSCRRPTRRRPCYGWAALGCSLAVASRVSAAGEGVGVRGTRDTDASLHRDKELSFGVTPAELGDAGDASQRVLFVPVSG